MRRTAAIDRADALESLTADIIRRAEAEEDAWARDTVPGPSSHAGGRIMTSSVWLWLLSLWMLATAAGIAIYWATWFRTPHTQTWQPDLAYFAQHGLFAREREGLLNLFLVVAVLALAAVLVPVGLP